MNVNKASSRNSNIEFLRIVAMLGVVILHFNSPSYGNAFEIAGRMNMKSFVLYGFESLFIPAVNIYIIILGYYMCEKTSINISKPIKLILQVIVCRIIIQMVSAFETGLSIFDFISALIPINYFVILYVTVYILAPFINLFIRQLTEKIFFKFVVILFMLFSVWPTMVDLLVLITGRSCSGLSTIGADGSQYGYTIIQFVVMYIIGAFIRKNNIKYNFKKCLSVLISANLMIFASSYVFLELDKDLSVVWSYCNPLVVVSSICIFMIFSNKKVAYNSIINKLANGSFMVFLLHAVFLKPIISQKIISFNMLFMMLSIMFFACIIYLCCWFVGIIYEKIERKLLKKLWIFLEKFEIICEEKKK